MTSRCDCKGHAYGNYCPFNQSSGLRSCQCQGNTCGMQCDQCCPLYNQFPWKPGSGAPWRNDPNAECERKLAVLKLYSGLLGERRKDRTEISVKDCLEKKLVHVSILPTYAFVFRYFALICNCIFSLHGLNSPY